MYVMHGCVNIIYMYLFVFRRRPRHSYDSDTRNEHSVRPHQPPHHWHPHPPPPHLAPLPLHRRLHHIYRGVPRRGGHQREGGAVHLPHPGLRGEAGTGGRLVPRAPVGGATCATSAHIRAVQAEGGATQQVFLSQLILLHSQQTAGGFPHT